MIHLQKFNCSRCANDRCTRLLQELGVEKLIVTAAVGEYMFCEQNREIQLLAFATLILHQLCSLFQAR